MSATNPGSCDFLRTLQTCVPSLTMTNLKKSFIYPRLLPDYNFRKVVTWCECHPQSGARCVTIARKVSMSPCVFFLQASHIITNKNTGLMLALANTF